MNFLDTFTKNKSLFYQEDGTLYWYLCGPTVYDSSHIGHARTYITFDLIKKTMESLFGYRVFQIMNITDIDNKIIKKSIENNVDYHFITSKYEVEFWEDMNALGVSKPEYIGRITQYIPECLKIISKLIEDGWAYLSNGSVYFRNKVYLENRGLEPFREENLHTENPDKNNSSDFVLWKKSSSDEIGWDSPFGKGRPGWHLECVAIALDAQEKLGNVEIGLHSGGIDLQYPHHFNEQIIAEAYLKTKGDKKWIKTFTHSGHLMIDGLKMSKSLKNFLTIRDILQQYSKEELRFFFLSHKWSDSLEFSEESLKTSNQFFKKFLNFFDSINSHSFVKEVRIGKSYFELVKALELTKTKVESYLLDNFRSDMAVRELAELVSLVNYKLMEVDCSKEAVMMVKEYLLKLFGIWGLLRNNSQCGKAIEIIKKIRSQVRQAKLYELSDQIRDQYLKEELGFQLQDK